MLTILLFVDVEKRETLLERFFYSMREWNREPLESGDVRILLITQKQNDTHSREVAAAQPFGVEVVDAAHPRDESGYPVWDVLEECRQVWDRVDGEYVTWSHAEFLWLPGRLSKTVEWLKQARPVAAMGNLRRLGKYTPSLKTEIGTREATKGCSDAVEAVIDRMPPDEAAKVIEFFPSWHWVYWLPEPDVGGKRWGEDVTFLRRDWLDDTRFLHHGGALPFQDVYDLLQVGFQTMETVGSAPPCPRMPRDVCEMYHLWHPKFWSSWTPAMRRWFYKDPDAWSGTTFLRDDIWTELFNQRANQWTTDKAVCRVRRDPGGTVTRWHRDFAIWMCRGGLAVLRSHMG